MAVNRRPASWKLPIALYALLGVLLVPVYPHGNSPNEFSRWAIAVAIVDYRTLELGPLMRDVRMPIGDLSQFEGRVYSNKSPGVSLLTLPVYAAARAITGPPKPGNIRFTLNAMRIAGATIPLLLLAAWLASVARRLGIADDRIAVAVTVLLFATPLFAYGLSLFSHALLALLLFGAWVLLFESEWRWRAYGAGALIGLAVLSEPPVFIPAAALIVCALPRLGVGGLLRVGVGGVPFAAAFAIYNAMAFGSPLALPNYYDASPDVRALNRSGFFGLNPPSLTWLLDMLFDSSKGLLVLSPVLLLALAGLMAARQRLSTASFVALLVVPMSLVLVISGYEYWYGGRSIGPRYILPIVPFLVLLIAFARETFIEPILTGASAAVIAVLALVFPLVPSIFGVPWVSFSLPLLIKGLVAPNLLHLVWWPLAVIVPFAIVALAVVRPFPRRHIALLVVGAGLWFAMGWLAEKRQPSPPYFRVLTEEVHFVRHGAIERAFPPGHPARIRLRQMADQQKRLPPPAWPATTDN